MVGDRTRRALGRLVDPRGDKVVEYVRARSERDPVLLRDRAEIGEVLLEQVARADVRLIAGLIAELITEIGEVRHDYDHYVSLDDSHHHHHLDVRSFIITIIM